MNELLETFPARTTAWGHVLVTAVVAATGMLFNPLVVLAVAVVGIGVNLYLGRVVENRVSPAYSSGHPLENKPTSEADEEIKKLMEDYDRNFADYDDNYEELHAGGTIAAASAPAVMQEGETIIIPADSVFADPENTTYVKDETTLQPAVDPAVIDTPVVSRVEDVTIADDIDAEPETSTYYDSTSEANG